MTDATATTSGGKSVADTLPLGAYRTFDSFIGGLREKDALPHKIDRSIMVGKSGGDMAFLLSALRFFGLIDAAGVIQDRLARLVAAEPEARPALLRDLVEARYPRQVELSKSNGTKEQLLTSIAEDFGVNGDTRRKGMTFLLHMMKAAKMPISEYFPDVRSGSGGGATGTGRKGVKRKRSSSGGEPSGTTDANGGGGGGAITGDSYRVVLRGGGTVTVIVNESHFNLSKNRTDREFVNGLVDAMIDYAAGSDQDVISDEKESP